MNEAEFKRDLNKKLIYLKSLNSRDDKVINTIDTILGFLDEKDIEFDNYKDAIVTIYCNLANSSFIWDDIRLLSEMYVPFYDEPQVHKNFSKDDLFLFVYDFYKNNTDKYLFKVFDKLFSDRLYNVNFFEKTKYSPAVAESISLPYYNTNYINLYLKGANGMETIAALAHEYGHAIQDSINFQSKFEYFEIVSLFFEMLCCEYYSKLVFNYEAVYLQINDTINEILVSSYEFVNLLNVFDKLELYKNNKQTTRNINNMSERYAKYIIKDNENGFENYQYITATIVASNLFMLYLEDKEKALYLLTKLINIDAKLSVVDYYRELDGMGLTGIDGFCEYKDYIVRKL